MTSWLLPTREATNQFGEALGRLLRPGQAIALVGDLGAGKTAITQAIARGMGIQSYVSSPTFGLIHEYPGPIPLFHFDPYRLQRAEDLMDLGYDEYFHRGGVVVIEWADKFPEILPDERLTLRLAIEKDMPLNEVAEDAPRRLEVEAIGAEYRDLLYELKSAMKRSSSLEPT